MQSKKFKKLIIIALVVILLTPILAIFAPNLIIQLLCATNTDELCGVFIYWPLVAASILLPLLAGSILVIVAFVKKK